MKNIKLKDLLKEGIKDVDLEKIEKSLKKKFGNKITTKIEMHDKPAGPRSYEKINPILYINKGNKKNEISITIGGNHEIEWGYIVWSYMSNKSFKSWDLQGIYNYCVKKLEI